jgi:Domain of unknown function (DUF4082)
VTNLAPLMAGGGVTPGTPHTLFATRGTSGPVNGNSYSGDYIAGLIFTVNKAGCFFQGYWWWVCSGTNPSPTAPQKCCLWSLTSGSAGVVVAGSTVTSGTLVAGWNYIPLPTPIPIAPGGSYIAAVAVNGNFPDTTNQFGTGDPFAAGIQSGPIFAYADYTVGGSPYPVGVINGYTPQQGLFSTVNTDPTVAPPLQGSNQSNLWVDVQILDGPPAGYSGTYRFWPNVADAVGEQTDTANNFVLSTEIALSRTATLHNIWFYSPSGVTQLPTSVDIWSTAGAHVKTFTPSWSGVAGSGWVSAPVTGTLAAGKYYVSVYNGGAVVSFSSRTSGYWTTGGFGQSGFSTGPLSAPNLANATTAWLFSSSGQSNSPPWSDGSTRLPGQSVFAIGPPNQVPYLYVTPTPVLAECFFVDLEVS